MLPYTIAQSVIAKVFLIGFQENAIDGIEFVSLLIYVILLQPSMLCIILDVKKINWQVFYPSVVEYRVTYRCVSL